MAFTDPILYHRYHLTDEAHELGSRGISARHPLFGAKGDYDPVAGTGTDDTAALQAWINHAQDVYDALERGAPHLPPASTPPDDYTGVVLVLPAGNYKVSGTLLMTRPLRIQGAGWNEAVIHATTDAPILHFERRVHAMQPRAVIRGIGFEGTHVKFYANTGRANQHGLKLTKHLTTTGNAHVDVEDCGFYGLGGAGIFGNFTETADPNAGGDKFRVRGCHIAICGDFGIRLQGRHATAYITGNHIHECAGGIGLLGTAALPVSTAVIEGNVIEANTAGTGAPGSATNPAVGIQISRGFIARIERNYFEWHLNGVYLVDACWGIQIVRNHFDGNDVNLPRVHAAATGNRISRQLSPVYWEPRASPLDPEHQDVLVAENDVYVPSRPATYTTPSDLLDWSPTGAWGEKYPVFPSVHGYAHQLLRNSARLLGGEVQDATYMPEARGKLYYETVAPEVPGSSVTRYHAEAGLLSFGGDVRMSGSIIGNGWRTLIQVSKNPGGTSVSYHNLGTAPVLSGTLASADDASGPLLATTTNPSPAGVFSGNYSVAAPGWLPEFTTSIVVGQLTDIRVWAGFFSGDPAGHHAPGVRIAAFRFDSAYDTGSPARWRCVTSSGSGSPTETTTSVEIVAGQRYRLRVRFIDGGTAEFSINGIVVATHASNMPAAGQLLGFGNRVTALAAAARSIQTGRIAVSHNG